MITAPSPKRTIPPIQNNIEAERYDEVPTPMLPVNMNLKKLTPLIKRPIPPQTQNKIVSIIRPRVKTPVIVAAKSQSGWKRPIVRDARALMSLVLHKLGGRQPATARFLVTGVTS